MTEARPKAAIKTEEGPCVMPEELEMLPKTGVAAFGETFANAHTVTAKRSRLHDWTEAVSRAAGEDTKLDRVELLLVALKKLDLISGRQAARLLTLYLREKAVVRLPKPQEGGSWMLTPAKPHAPSAGVWETSVVTARNLCRWPRGLLQRSGNTSSMCPFLGAKPAARAPRWSVFAVSISSARH